MNKKTYSTKIDTWLLCLIFFSLATIWVASISIRWWFALSYGGTITLICLIGLCGYRYKIEDDTLTVYNFFRPHRFPISKIRDARKTVGYTSTAGLSKDRVSIRFTDRSVRKSMMPLEISPKDRDGFIQHLKRINPDINID